MFTGLIESVGVVREIVRHADGVGLVVAAPIAAELQPGESVAVNGVCLTVVTATDGTARFDIGPETAHVTTLGSIRMAETVNLERAMRADSRFGGHFVQGHIDGTGTVTSLRSDAGAHWVTVAFDAALAPYMIPKGSIALDGVSLTLAALRSTEFDVMIIPFTWEHTTLRHRSARDRVNLECDMVGKYVARAAQTR